MGEGLRPCSYFYGGFTMDKYKSYSVGLQSDRIQLDILCALDRIVAILESKYNDGQIVSDKVVEEIKTEVKKKTHKSGGDK